MSFVRLLTLSAVIGIAACSPRHDPMAEMSAQRQQLVSSGHTPLYAEGYADGCSSANYSKGDTRYNFIKNETLFAADDDYALAWRQGYRACDGSKQYAQDGFHVKRKNHEKFIKTEEGKKVWDELKK